MSVRCLAAPLTVLALLVAGCSGGGATQTTSTTTTTTTAPTSSATTSAAMPSPLTSRSGTPTAPATPVALPAGTKWLAVPALKTRLAIPTSWKAVDLAALREQKGTPAFAKAAAGLGYTEQELADFTASGAVAMAVGPDAGETAPNLLVRSVGGGTFSDGEQLTSGSRGATGTLDAQSKATTPGGPAVRGDWHAPLDGLTVHASQLAVEVSGQQDIVTVAAQDAQTVKKVMDGVVASYSPAP